MARIRTIKPEFWPDEKLALLPPITRLVFLGLISQADDAGRLVDNVKLLDGLLFPYTDDSCMESLEELAAMKRITRYRSASGQTLIQVANWDKHQNVQKPSPYVLPPPDETHPGDIPEVPRRVPVSDQRPTTGERRAGTRARAKDRAPQPKRSRRCPPDFEPDESHTAIAQELGISLSTELVKFRDHEFGSPRSDWPATFRNWLRRAEPKNGGRNGAHPPDESPEPRIWDPEKDRW